MKVRNQPKLRRVPRPYYDSSHWNYFRKSSMKEVISLSNIRPIIIYFHSSQCRLIPYLHQRPIFFKTNSSIVAILELIRGAQCLIEVIRFSCEEIWRVDAYQIPYYSRGIEGDKRTRPRFADWLSVWRSGLLVYSVIFIVDSRAESTWDRIDLGRYDLGRNDLGSERLWVELVWGRMDWPDTEYFRKAAGILLLGVWCKNIRYNIPIITLVGVWPGGLSPLEKLGQPRASPRVTLLFSGINQIFQ